MSISLRSLATLVLALAGGGVAAAPVLQHYQHEQVLGTSLRMSVAGVGPAEAEAAHAAALAEALLAWRDKKSAALRARCREAIETRYNPQAQATIIDAVVSEVCHAR